MPFPHEAILGLDFFSALVDAFLQITRGLRPLVILGNASTCAEKKSNPRIASWRKDTFHPLLSDRKVLVHNAPLGNNAKAKIPNVKFVNCHHIASTSKLL